MEDGDEYGMEGPLVERDNSSGGSADPPGRPGASTGAVLAVDTPALWRPPRRPRWSTLALRRPPTPMTSQRPSLHRGAVSDRHRSRGRDSERCWNCNAPNSNYIMSLGDGFFCSLDCRDFWHHEHPDSDHGARGWPETWEVAADAATNPLAANGDGVLINNQNAPGLGDNIPPGPGDPNNLVIRDEVRARWIAAGMTREQVDGLLQCGQNIHLSSQPWIDPNMAPDIRAWWQQHVIDN